MSFIYAADGHEFSTPSLYFLTFNSPYFDRSEKEFFQLTYNRKEKFVKFVTNFVDGKHLSLRKYRLYEARSVLSVFFKVFRARKQKVRKVRQPSLCPTPY